MKIFIATETRVCIVGDRLYTSNSFRVVLERYHKAFHDVVLCTRFLNVDENDLPKSYEDATDFVDSTVELANLKEIVFGKKDKHIQDQIKNCRLVVARVPSVVAYRTASIAKKLGIPYMVEVVGCTWDSYWNYNWKSKALALPSYLLMRKVVKNANYASYVTEYFLQKRYPCNCDSIHASNVIVDCSENGVLERRLEKIRNKQNNKFVLFTAAAIDVAYKGQEYVIKAVQILQKKGIRIEYRLGGNGNPDRLKRIASECGVSDNVKFLGGLSRTMVIQELDSCDVYIQPSLQEGLPRSVIEAMSRGCPALGARTAGIPELIASECVFKRANPADTAKAIKWMLNENMEKYARMNYSKAQEYDKTVLEKRRNGYYQKIMNEVG